MLAAGGLEAQHECPELYATATRGTLMLNTEFESVNAKFESERIVIVGGTSGIGLATAERAAADGATVIVASSSAERINAALERLPASAEGYTVDVRHEEEIRDLFSRLGSFDHL